jgi:hypothetical protein
MFDTEFDLIVDHNKWDPTCQARACSLPLSFYAISENASIQNERGTRSDN